MSTTNTVAGVNLAEVAQESLEGLTNLLAPLASLHTDFSADIKDAGESVTTRYPKSVTAANMSVGYETAAEGVETIPRTINLNSHVGYTYGFTDVERSKSKIKLNNLFIEPALDAIATKVFKDLWSLITPANFAQKKVVALDDFEKDNIVDFRTTLTKTNKAPQTNRSVLLNPDYYGQLVKGLNTSEHPGITTNKTEAIVPRTSKFDIHETIDPLTTAENTHNLAGFAFHKNALLMAARLVDTELAEKNCEIETIILPGINLPVQFRRWYNNNGRLYYNMNILYGVAAGVDYGVRIKSASSSE